MKKRNYAKEWEKEKLYKKKVPVTVTPEIYEDFRSACELNETTMNAVLKEFIYQYIAEN